MDKLDDGVVEEALREATEKVEVEVTAADIMFGTAHAASSCAIAIALRRTGRWDSIVVRYNKAYLDATPYALPPEARVFIREFDFSKNLVKPITFTMTRRRHG